MTTQPPGPKSNLIKQILFYNRFRKDMLGQLASWKKTYGDRVHFKVGSRHIFMTVLPEDMHQIMSTQAAKFHKGPYLKDPNWGTARALGNGLFTSDGPFWLKQHKLIKPLLQTKHVLGFTPIVVDCIHRLLESWQEGEERLVDADFFDVSMEALDRAVLNGEIYASRQIVYRLLRTVRKLANSPRVVPLWFPTPLHLAHGRAMRAFDQLIHSVVEKRRASGQGSTDRGDLLSTLLLAAEKGRGRPLTDKEIRDEMATMILAGHESSANTLAWLFYLLARNPEVVARLQEEVDEVLGGRLPTLADLDRLVYSEKVIKETLRLYPPSWGFDRQAMEDVTINGIHYPKGSEVFLIAIFTQRDERWFENPEEFRPERFSEEEKHKIPKFAYLPFGAGPRVCIGQAFAMLVLKLVLAMVTQRFQLSLAPGHEVTMDPWGALRPKGGLPMRVITRERASAPAAG